MIEGNQLNKRYVIIVEENQSPFNDSDINEVLPMENGTQFFITGERQVTILAVKEMNPEHSLHTVRIGNHIT